MIFKPHKSSSILMKKAARLFEQTANQNLKQFGVTYAQTTFLIRLGDQDGQSQIELCKSAGVKQPTVVRTLDRMVRDKLITRVPCKDDRRSVKFYLTEKAKLICKKLTNYAKEMNDIAIEGLNKKEVEQLNALMDKVILNLETHLDANK